MTDHHKTIHLIAAARPNFMKIAPLYHALKKEPWAKPVIVHTGQHYDLNMSDAFFIDLELPEPDFHLGVGSGTHAEQTGRVMVACEKLFMEEKPDLVVVVGDVNSTMAATLAAVKIGVSVAHLEAGLRSFDRTMPEEINRLVTDTLADILWTPSPDADENLKNEGIAPEKIVRVGNIMIDSLEMLRDRIEKQETYNHFNLKRGEYGVVTLHRPSNVDSKDILSVLCNELLKIAERSPLIFPVHPRTRKNLEQYGLLEKLSSSSNLCVIDPISYLPFMNLIFNSRFVITDSGGIQEETTYLGIPCITVRPNTERPITILQGTNYLCEPTGIVIKINMILGDRIKKRTVPDMWDGHTSVRVSKSIIGYLSV